MAENAFDPAAYGRHAAADYDELYAAVDPGDAVETLAELAENGPVLELGIGTGRLALPLAARGLAVSGIEGSPEMARRLAEKSGGDEIPVVIGNFADADAGRDFSLVVLAINTIYALPSQDAQVDCFCNAARHLGERGRFVVEAWVPDPGAFRNGTAVRPVQLNDGYVELEVAQIHPADQTMRTNKVHLGGAAGVRVVPANHRYAWPAELDLMARLAGLRLEHRWENWRRTTFTDASRTHVSVWRRT
jgi:SAM-dependent methyltransferase